MIKKKVSELERGDMVIVLTPRGNVGYPVPILAVVDYSGIDNNISTRKTLLYFMYYDSQGDCFLRVAYEHDIDVHVIGFYDIATNEIKYHTAQQQPPPLIAGNRRTIDVNDQAFDISQVKRQLVIAYDGTADTNERIFTQNNLPSNFKGQPTDIMENLKSELTADVHIIAETCYRTIKAGAKEGFWKDYEKRREVDEILNKLWE